MTEGARGEIIWTPPDDAAATSRIGQFTRWLASDRGLEFSNYDDLRQWSVSDLEVAVG